MGDQWQHIIGWWLLTGEFNGVRRENQNRQHQGKSGGDERKLILKYNSGRRCWIKYDQWRVYRNGGRRRVQ